MTTGRRRSAAQILTAARALAASGRPRSAAALRVGLTPERLLHALSQASRPAPARADPPLSTQIRAATILDEFSANSFASAFAGAALSPELWRENFEETRPEVFFCESAWSGPDGQARPWKGKIYASRNFQRENRGVLLEILAHCRKAGIPTVFWNKEDPAHYGDRVHDFVKTAALFDHVFTTAAECVPLYRQDDGLRSVHVLPFAANPEFFNPIETAPRSEAVTFAGSWYANHLERSERTHHMLRVLRAAGYELEIYDRYSGDSDPLHLWPAEYAPFLRPAIPHDQIAAVYKRGRFALNVNTVTQSRTMFARRVFELMACNTLVLSNHSVGMEEMFGADVVFCDREPERLARLRPEEIEAMRERSLNRVLSLHSYRRRWEEILTAIGWRFRPAQEAVTVIWPVRRPEDAWEGVAWLQQEADLTQDRLLLLAMDEMSPLETADLYASFNRFGVGVTSLRHAEDLAMTGRYAPIETSHALILAPEAPPPPGWLARARLHLQYARTQPIQPARHAQERYRLAPASAREALLYDAALDLSGALDGSLICRRI